ncbi:MAG: hypothetical protein ACE5ID_01755 [Acidobacteriota bacterium]
MRQMRVFHLTFHGALERIGPAVRQRCDNNDLQEKNIRNASDGRHPAPMAAELRHGRPRLCSLRKNLDLFKTMTGAGPTHHIGLRGPSCHGT